jgi:hypothetical protein
MIFLWYVLFLGKQDLETEGGMQPDKLRGRVSSNGAGITKDDIFGTSKIPLAKLIYTLRWPTYRDWWEPGWLNARVQE